MNYGQKFVTLNRRQGSRPSPRKRNARTTEARIYNGKKIASLTSGAGKIGQPLVKE